MAVVTNTFQSTSAVGNREELSDIVNMITPEDTPIYSMISKGTAKSTSPEWEKDDLAAPAANAQLEGDEFTYEAVTPPDRMKNHTQIMRKAFIISNTQEAVDNAGRQEQIKRQRYKKGVEIRKDTEFAILDNNASVAGATREIGGLPSWYETNTTRSSAGSPADGGYSSGSGLTVAATNGTLQAFTKTKLDTTLQDIYTSGGTVSHAVVSPYVKSVFTTFMSDSNVASFRYAASGSSNSIIATADVYESDFGKIMITPNRVMAGSATLARNVHLLDASMLEFKWLRKIKEVKVTPTGDAEKRVLVGEGTLCVKNEAGLGVVADVFGLTAST